MRMEFNEALYFVIGLAIFTLVVTRLKMRSKQKLGYIFTHFGNDLDYKSGVLNVDGSKVFAIVIENKGSSDVIVTDMYIEIKEGSRYKKHAFPADVFDTSNEMIIPSKKSGASFIDISDFRKMFSADADFRTVVDIKEQKSLKSLPMTISGKKKEISLK